MSSEILIDNTKEAIDANGEVNNSFVYRGKKINVYRKGEDVWLSDNFHLREFECPGDEESTTLVCPDHVNKLQLFREQIKKPILINSAYRYPAYNARIGGASRSRHMIGDATDIVVPGMKPKEVADVAERFGFDGVGRYPTFTHLDSRGYRARWGYN